MAVFTTKQALLDEVRRILVDNTSGDVSVADIRGLAIDMVDSLELITDGFEFHHGTAVPANSLGKNGDVYLETDTSKLYRKDSGSWDLFWTAPTGSGGATDLSAYRTADAQDTIDTAQNDVTAVNTSRISHLERRGGGSLNLYHLGAGSEQYTQAEFAALTDQNLTITGHIDDPELLPDGLFFLLITNGDGSHTVKTQNASSTVELEVFQLGTTKRTARNLLSAGEVKFTFQITTAEMSAIFRDASRQAIESAFVEFQVGLGRATENNVLASYFENLVGTGLTADQALAIQRAGQGVLLARQEAREADGKATVAQEQNAGQDTRLEAIEDDGWVTNVRLAQEVKDAIAAVPPVTIADPVIEPEYWVDDNEARTYAVHFDAAALALTGATKVRLTIQGNSVTVNIAADQHTYEFAYDATASANISNARRVGQTVRADTFVLDASDNQLHHVIGLLRVVAEAPGGGGGGWTFVGETRAIGVGSTYTWVDTTLDVPSSGTMMLVSANIVHTTDAIYEHWYSILIDLANFRSLAAATIGSAGANNGEVYVLGGDNSTASKPIYLGRDSRNNLLAAGAGSEDDVVTFRLHVM